MDAVCLKGDWDVIMEKDEEGGLAGVLVYHYRRYYGFNLILMPPMTAYNGIHIIYPKGKSDYSLVSYQYKVSEALISRLPKHSLYYQQYHTAYDNWLALYWKGYKETTRYTYILDGEQSKASATKELRDNLRRSIKNAEKACHIEEVDFDTYWREAKLSFETKKRPIPINKQALENLCANLCPEGKMKIRACKNKETGKYLSGAVMAEDSNTIYYVSGFHHADVKPSGSMAHVIWDSIFSSDKTKFDFEGSIIKEVEFYFRSFGGKLTPHYRIFNVPNPLLRIGLALFKPNFFA